MRSSTCSLLRNVPGLDQQLVDQRRFAVVNVGDNGNVAYIMAFHEFLLHRGDTSSS